MDRAILEQHLALAEQLVTVGEACIQRQREIVAFSMPLAVAVLKRQGCFTLSNSSLPYISRIVIASWPNCVQLGISRSS
jgi:hypothetical protein